MAQLTISDYCNQSELQASLVVKHQIPEDKCDLMVNSFFSWQVPAPSIYKASDIAYLIDNADCASDHLQFDFDSTNTADNLDVVPKIVANFVTKFSIPFFKGIFYVFNPDEFHFYKAIGPDGYTIAIKVFYNNGKIYFGDLSGLEP